MKFTKIEKRTNVTIVTSGYADRWLKRTSTITITITVRGKGETAECRFQDSDGALDFLAALEMDFDEAWPIVNDAPTTHTMSANIAPRHWQSVIVTPAELQSVEAFLKVRRAKGWTQEAVDKRLKWLNAHPVPNTLMKIVEGQLAECDRQNTEMWGHPHGHQAAKKAGIAMPE